MLHRRSSNLITGFHSPVFYGTISSVDGIGYENWCARQLRRYGYTDVRTTRKTGDQGIDLIAGYRGRKYGFQCKYYSSPVGNDAVQQAYAGITYYGLDEAVVMTNTVFTASAKDLAEETGVFLWENMDPMKKKQPLRLLSIPLTALGAYGICLSAAAFKNAPQSAEVSLLAIAASADLIFAIGIRRYGAVVTAAVLSLFFIAAALFCSLKCTLFLCLQAAAAILMMIRAAVLKKKREMRGYEEEREQLSGLIADSQQKLAELTACLLAEELGCSIRVAGVKKQRDGSRVIAMHAGRSVGEDVPVAVYSLNRYAEYHRLHLNLSCEVTDPRSFAVTVRSR